MLSRVEVYLVCGSQYVSICRILYLLTKLYSEIIKLWFLLRLILDQEAENHSKHLKKMQPIVCYAISGIWEQDCKKQWVNSRERSSPSLFYGPHDFSLRGIYSSLSLSRAYSLFLFPLDFCLVHDTWTYSTWQFSAPIST